MRTCFRCRLRSAVVAVILPFATVANADDWDFKKLMPKPIQEKLDALKTLSGQGQTSTYPGATSAPPAVRTAPAQVEPVPITSAKTIGRVNVDTPVLEPESERVLRRLQGQLLTLYTLSTEHLRQAIFDPQDIAFVDALPVQGQAEIIGRLVKSTRFIPDADGKLRDVFDGMGLRLVLRTFPQAQEIIYIFHYPDYASSGATRNDGIFESSGTLKTFMTSMLIDDVDGQRQINARLLKAARTHQATEPLEKYAQVWPGYFAERGNYSGGMRGDVLANLVYSSTHDSRARDLGTPLAVSANSPIRHVVEEPWGDAERAHTTVINQASMPKIEKKPYNPNGINGSP